MADHIRSRVESILSRYNISSPPIDVYDVARKLDIEIIPQLTSDDISGCLIRKDGRAAIGINDGHHPNRKRFTVAHEIGHFFLHEGREVFLDKGSAFRVDFRNLAGALGGERVEREANSFAAELLMPTNFLLSDLSGFDMNLVDDHELLRDLAERYQVSQQALTFRLMNLGYLTSL